MSANIYWRPVAKNNKSINTHAPSSFQEQMHSAGMALPCTVEQRHLEILKGMAIGQGTYKDSPNPFQQIVDLLEHHDEIELWAEH